MKLGNLHWGILRAPLLVLAAASAFAFALVFFTYRSSAASSAQLEREHAALNSIRQKTSQSDQERQLIVRYRDAYEDLHRSGTIGPEQRVNWLDALRAANQEAQTLGVDYQLSQQAASPIKLDTAGYKLQQTTMKLNIKLLHEEDLPNFLRALEAQRAGLYLLQSCSINRSANAAFSVRFEPKLSAECELAWLSLADIAAAETASPQ
jgi:hypothetical protein